MDREPNLDPYKRLFETMLDGAVVLDVTTGRIALANKAAAMIFGFPSPEEMVGLNPLDYVAQEDHEHVAQMMAESFERDRQAPAEMRIITRDKRQVWVSASGTLIEHEGRKATFTTIRDITSERAKDAALRDAERRYEHLFDGMLDGAVVLDVSTFQIVLANKAAADMFGFSSPRELVGENPLSYIPEDDRDEVARQIALNLQGEGRNPAEIRVITRDKRNIWVSATANTIDYEGRTATLTTLRDITADKAKDAALKAAEESKLQLIDAAADSIFVVQDWKMVYVNPAGAAVAGLSQKDMIGLSFQDFIHLDQREALTERYEGLLAGQLFSDFTTVKDIDARGETRWAEIREIPYSWQGRPAVMSLAHDITDRMRADEERKEREERFRSIIDNAWDGITILDENYSVIFESPSLARISGYTPEEWMGRPVGQMAIHPDDLVWLATRMETLKSQPDSVIRDVVVRYQHKDGSWRWIEATGRNLLHDPRVKGLVVNFRDISDKVQVEQALREREERSRVIVEKAWDGVFIFDDNYHVLFESPSLARMTGYTREEWLGTTPSQWPIHPDDLASTATLLENLRIQPGSAISDVRIRFKHKDGSWHIIEATGQNLLQDPKVKGIVVNFRDVTERLKAEEDLKASEQRFRALIENATDAVAIVGPNGEIIYESPAARRMAGHTTEEMVGHYVTEYIAPEDLGKVADLFVDLHGHPGKAIPPLQVRFKHEDGSWHTAEMTVQNLVHVPGIGGAVVNYRDVTERLSAMEALENSEQRFRDLLENANESILIIQDWKVAYVNRKLEEGIGIPRQSLAGLHILDLIHPDDRQAVSDRYQRIMNGEKYSSGAPLRGMDKDGKTKWGDAREIPFIWEGKPAMLSMIVDITERKEAEQELKNSEERFRTLIEKATDVIMVLDAGGKITYQSPSLERVTGYGPNEWLDRSLGDWFIHPDDLPSLAPLLERVLTQPGATLEGITARYKHKDGSWHTLEATVTNMLHDPKVAGIVANFHDITDRKEAEEQLKGSEDLYRSLVLISPDAVTVSDLKGCFTFVSPQTARLHGYDSTEELLGKTAFGLTAPEDQAKAASVAEALLTEGFVRNVESTFLRKDGSRFIGELSAALTRDANGDPHSIVGYTRDITERKEADQALRASEERNRLLIDNAAEVVTVIQDGLIKFINRKCIDFIGHLPEDLVSKSFIELIHPDDRQMVAENYVKRVQGEAAPAAYSFRVVHKSGDIRWASASVTLFNWEGKPATLGLLSDITERRKAEEALRQSEERLSLALEAASAGTFDWNMVTGEANFSDRYYGILGYAPNEISANFEAFQSLVHPDDEAALMGTLDQYRENRIDHHRIEIRLRAKSGDWRWVASHGRMVARGPAGQPERMVGAHFDITERRKAEGTLRESEEKFRLITEKTNDLVWMTDINLVTIYVSPSAERLLGFRPEELLKLSPESLMTPESFGRAQEILLKQLDLERDPMADRQRTLTLELEYYRKDGSTVWLENRISGIRDANGVLTGMHGVGRDISERKTAEESLKESEERFRTLIEKSTDAIAILDASGNLLYESPSMERITGYRLEDWLGKPVGDWLLHPDDLATMASLLEKLLSQPEAISEEVSVRFKHKDGSWHFLEGTVRNLLSDPKVKGLVINYRDVTERRIAEEAVRESEKKFRALFDSASDGIFIHHLAGPFIEVNEIACQQLGYTREELLRLTPRDIDSPEYAAKVAERTEELVRNGQAVFETAHLTKDGRVIPIEASSRIVDFGGKPAVLTTARDITERKKAQEALLSSEIKYRNLFEHTLLGMEVIDGETGKVVLSNHSMARMFGFKSPEDMAGTNPMDYVPPEDLEWVTKELAQVLADPEKRDVATLRAKTEDGRIIWVTASGTSFEYEGKPSMLLSLIEVTAAKEAEDKLRDSEEKNRLLIDNSIEAISVIQDGVIKFANRRFAESVGYSAQELVSRSFADFIHPDDRQRVAEYYFKRMGGEEAPSSYQFRWIDREAADHWGEASVAILNWEGRPATLCMLSDITERVKAEQALKDSEERFRALIEEATDAVAILEPSGKTVYYSPSMRRVTGYTPEEWAGKSLGDLLIHPDDLLSLASLLEKMKKPNATAEGVRVRYVHKDGLWHTLEATVRNMLHDPKIGGIVANFRDVTERVKAEQALKESEERYRLFADNVSDVIWVTDMNLKPIYISPSVARMLGYTGEQAMSGAADTRLTPASSQIALQAYADAMAKEAQHPGSEWDAPPLDLEMVRSDGSTIWTATKFSFIRANDGKPFAVLGVLRDVTERKKAEDSLRKSEERFRGLVETSSDWVWEMDRNSHYTYVSPKVHDILGHEPQELLGHTPFEFMHQREGRRVSKIVRRFADAHLPFSLLENTCTHKDGHSVVLETSAVPILDSDGGFLGYRGIDRDITERKKVEQELQHSLKRLEKTMESTIEAITTTIETRDPYTTGHQMRVTDLACAIAKVMEVPPTQIEGIRVAGLLHDIGKIAIPTEILSKPGKLTEVEFSMIKTHAQTGYNILKKIEFAWPVARAVLQHHERWNGSGYPHGLRGEDILLEARILAVADVMEAMASHRPYRPSVGLDKALDEISKNSGILYDPAVAKACETAFTQRGFEFASAVLGVVADSGSASSARSVHSAEDR
jgi:PAS domain S-box-containing protein/putative nucleotidyltransferase with HDIG domain